MLVRFELPGQTHLWAPVILSQPVKMKPMEEKPKEVKKPSGTVQKAVIQLVGYSFYTFHKGFGTRHTFVLMSALGMTLAHMLRVDLSVAIVSMVNTTSSDNESVSVCGEEEEDKDIFGVHSQAIVSTLRVPFLYSHHHQSMILDVGLCS